MKMTMITKENEYFLTNDDTLIKITYVAEDLKYFKTTHPFNIAGTEVKTKILHHYNDLGICFSVMGADYSHLNLKKKITPKEYPEYFI